MATKAGIFFAGVGTTFVILAVGFGGGLMLARTAMEPAPAASNTSADRLSAARVVLPASTEAVPPREQPVASETAPVPAIVHDPVQATAPVPPAPQALPTSEKPQLTNTEQVNEQAERAQRLKAKAEERENRRRVAERKARREAARIAKQQPEEQRPAQQPGILAFDGGEQPRSPGIVINPLGGLFGN